MTIKEGDLVHIPAGSEIINVSDNVVEVVEKPIIGVYTSGPEKLMEFVNTMHEVYVGDKRYRVKARDIWPYKQKEKKC